jgi:hypothetical protein
VDPLILAIVSRAAERLLDVAVGGLAIYLGYRMFVALPEQEKGTGRINLPGGISIYLSRVGPGVFFSLFGAIVIGLSLHYGVSFSDRAVEASKAQVSDAAQATVSTPGVQYSAVGSPQVAPVPVASLGQRNDVLRMIGTLNEVTGLLKSDIPIEQRVIVENGIDDAKHYLLATVWDSARWGERSAFVDWIRRHPHESPPAALAEPVGYFRAPSP